MGSFLKLQSILAQMVSGATKATSDAKPMESDDTEMESDETEAESEEKTIHWRTPETECQRSVVLILVPSGSCLRAEGGGGPNQVKRNA